MNVTVDRLLVVHFTSYLLTLPCRCGLQLPRPEASVQGRGLWYRSQLPDSHRRTQWRWQVNLPQAPGGRAESDPWGVDKESSVGELFIVHEDFLASGIKYLIGR